MREDGKQRSDGEEGNERGKEAGWSRDGRQTREDSVAPSCPATHTESTNLTIPEQ